MNPEDCTLLLGIDEVHLEELRRVWPTWVQFKPEILRMPAIVFYDPSQVHPGRAAFLEIDHPNIRWIEWDQPAARTQREKMIAGFVHVPAIHVATQWYLKLDTDAVATGHGAWIEDKWFEPDKCGRIPVFVSARWGYSKPRYVIELLDDWADQVPELKNFARLNVPYTSSGKSRVFHRRVISWIFFGQTEWTRKMAKLLPSDGRLPWASQDTFLSFCAKRTRQHWVRVAMARFHWSHRRLGKIDHHRDRAACVATGPTIPKRTTTTARGVIYYNTGTSCAVRLLVSLASLRRWYSGPVTILSEGEDSHVICERIAEVYDVKLQRWDCGVPPGPNRVYLAKANYHLGTPYEVTIALDSDTLVTGEIDELFQIAEEGSFCVARLGQWRSNGTTIAKRVRRWSEWLPREIDAAISFGPAINCGVVAFRRDTPLYRDWLALALPGRATFIPEEVCCQIVLQRYPHRVLDGRWNRSCKHDDPTLPDTRIIHYHGRKHCRAGLPFHGELWVAALSELIKQNIAGVEAWLPAGDRTLSRWLRSGSPIRSSGMTAGVSFLKTADR